MSELELTQTKISDGVWQAVLRTSSAEQPQIEVTHAGKSLGDVQIAQHADTDHWTLTVPIPRQAISDGVNTLLIHDSVAKVKIGHITLIAGEPLEDDLRAEIALLRAELDMLKRAFRRHCMETT